MKSVVTVGYYQARAARLLGERIAHIEVGTLHFFIFSFSRVLRAHLWCLWISRGVLITSFVYLLTMSTLFVYCSSFQPGWCHEISNTSCRYSTSFHRRWRGANARPLIHHYYVSAVHPKSSPQMLSFPYLNTLVTYITIYFMLAVVPFCSYVFLQSVLTFTRRPAIACYVEFFLLFWFFTFTLLRFYIFVPRWFRSARVSTARPTPCETLVLLSLL